MVSASIAVFGMAVTYGIMKNKIEVLLESNKEKDKKVDALHKRMDTHGDDIVKLNTRAELSMTAKDVDDKYVSKEIFKQMEKNIDNKMESLEKHLSEKVETMGKSIEKALNQVLVNQMSMSDKLEKRGKVYGSS